MQLAKQQSSPVLLLCPDRAKLHLLRGGYTMWGSGGYLVLEVSDQQGRVGSNVHHIVPLTVRGQLDQVQRRRHFLCQREVKLFYFEIVRFSLSPSL